MAFANLRSFRETFSFEKELGKGNYSTVYLGKNPQTQDACAIKCIVKEKLTREDEAALKIEVEILRSINHPSVIRFMGFYDEQFEYYIVTEVMNGGELFDRIVAREFYSEGNAQSIVHTLATCLKYLHEQDIVHRDLKPENILLKDYENDDSIKIADFGFARYVKEGCHTACGTPGYVAPEIRKQQKDTCEQARQDKDLLQFVLCCVRTYRSRQ